MPSIDRLDPIAREISGGLPWPVKAFLIGLVIPWIIPLGPLNLSAYRIILLVALLPTLWMWVRGKGGPIRVADIAVILFCVWASLSFVMVAGFEQTIEAMGILNIETMGAYLLARCYIRTADDFRNMIQFASNLVVFLLPFTLFEWITGAKPLLTGLAVIFPTLDITMMEPRWGFWRVQGPFAHSIVYGLFCGSFVALTYMVLGRGKGILAGLMRPAAITLAAFVSMSSAPIAGIVLQFALITWNSLLKRFTFRWKLLWGMALVAYLIVEFGSNQTPVKFYISRFTFDAQTGWFRLLIWDYGSASVANHPLFGIGLGQWVRPSWMPESVDNFWLLIAMRHGIPAVALLFVAWLAITCGVAYKKGLDERTDAYRTGFVFCMFMFLLVGCTVHFWAATYAWFMFMLGSGVWILDVKPLETSSSELPGSRSSKIGPSPEHRRHGTRLSAPRR
ncbi:O-antigen ligase family protein [Rhizobiaceae bacterium n13]|uniref:O-antigen ligase family protein n=1 Tax=Ferirhizobium litorale TaxID=2927786 RepID=A0AAE3U2D0_9HYPH|nr:O-antigen ligase family protein [Fererhizobium litorale]MDI7860716.1 O-antigen ligase family protein [Fererhizobium litorale]MDI7920864.1 O-antigen ligase family protein [Fererhizobium litorale]